MPVTARQALQSALKGGLPSLYLDTTVILDLLRPSRRPISVNLIEGAEQRSWSCISSYLSIMEALDSEQEMGWITKMMKQGESVDRLLRNRQDRELSEDQLQRIRRKMNRTFVRRYRDYIDWVYLDEDGWNTAVGLAQETNIWANDCIHLATALITACDVLVTSDKPFRRRASTFIATASPEETSQQMLELSP